MSEFLSHGLVPIAIGAVAVVLLLGLINMMRGGSGNTSQKLMRLRVLLQFVAIVDHHVHDLGDGDNWRSAMVVLNKIYTRTGDDGTTALGTGERRKKYDLRIAAYGTLDEANAAIGIARLYTAEDAALDSALSRIQNDLFDVGADLATPGKGKGPGGARLTVTADASDLARKRDRPAQRRDSRRLNPSSCPAAVRRRLICILPAPCAGAPNGSSPNSRTNRARASLPRC